ncbi:MAG TPA: hypothetical protein VFK16_00720 [Gemmatimonadaceae bacterium]|jgi:hypothetical protein|nr:hypothetical protein [Gemmatimonadaceae bacterium]
MRRRAWWALGGSIGLLALAASATGLRNQFAYDDVDMIQMDARVHTLAHWWHLFAQSYWAPTWGGDGYRPLTVIGFAVQWAVGHGTPLIYHIVNVTLYVALCVAVFWLMVGVLPRVPAWIAAALFAVHPVHVEAVGNVVGQSELTTGLLLVLAMGIYIHGRRRGPLPAWKQVAIVVLYGLAMLFKEHGITLVALVVLAEITVVPDARPLRVRLVQLRPFLLGMVAMALAYLWARGVVLSGGLAGFHPYAPFQGLHLSTSDRILTMIGLSPQWLRLFYWPAHLATEYAPRYVTIAQGVELWELPGLLLIVSTLGLFFATLRKAPLAAFGIGWVIIALSPVSNFLLPAGFLIAERTLLFPSVGAMLLLGALIPYFHDWLASRRVAWVLGVAVAGLLVAGAWRSAMRQRVWYDNETLMTQMVKDTPDSYRAHFMLGSWYMDTKRSPQGNAEYRKAMLLFPFDPSMAFSLAENYRVHGFCKQAIKLYGLVIELDSTSALGRPQLAACLLKDKQYQAARMAALDAMRHGAPVVAMHWLVLLADSAEAHPGAPVSAGPSARKTPESLQNTPPATRPRAPATR